MEQEEQTIYLTRIANAMEMFAGLTGSQNTRIANAMELFAGLTGSQNTRIANAMEMFAGLTGSQMFNAKDPHEQ